MVGILAEKAVPFYKSAGQRFLFTPMRYFDANRIRELFTCRPDHFIERLQQQCVLGVEVTQALRDGLNELPAQNRREKACQIKELVRHCHG